MVDGATEINQVEFSMEIRHGICSAGTSVPEGK
jgi:hypothetical protein